MQTALENGLKPLEYLTHVFTQIQRNEEVPIQSLLPWAEEMPTHCKLPQDVATEK
ncbi:transposase domain-containing protein [Sporomusa acidovorans]|uniref:transposase domain-containing protein n=1 Tax=Sporomusa acidovorans TaxID=112900 RepID=UPI003CCBB27A